MMNIFQIPVMNVPSNPYYVHQNIFQTQILNKCLWKFSHPLVLALNGYAVEKMTTNPNMKRLYLIDEFIEKKKFPSYFNNFWKIRLRFCSPSFWESFIETKTRLTQTSSKTCRRWCRRRCRRRHSGGQLSTSIREEKYIMVDTFLQYLFTSMKE